MVSLILPSAQNVCFLSSRVKPLILAAVTHHTVPNSILPVPEAAVGGRPTGPYLIGKLTHWLYVCIALVSSIVLASYLTTLATVAGL